MSDDNFKNPFQADEEQLEMISLQQDSATLPSVSSQPPTFSSEQPLPQPSSPPSGASMFDTIDRGLEQAAKEENEEEPPLLEDIGINPELIKKRMIAILTMRQPEQQLVTDPDLSGPFIIAFTLGFLLLLGGKIHFSDIEGGFLIGAILLYFLFNCMNKAGETLSLYVIMSFLGYSLLPMLFLAALGIFLPLSRGSVAVGLILAVWSSYSCSGLLAVLLGRQDSRWMVVYPLFLFYLSFALIIIY